MINFFARGILAKLNEPRELKIAVRNFEQLGRRLKYCLNKFKV